MYYVDLKLKIAEWLLKDNADSVIPNFIKWGQEYIENELIKTDLAVPDMEYESPTTTYLAKDANSIGVPSDLIELKYFYFTDQIRTPVNTAHTSGAGTLGAGTYYYRVSAVNANGETLASTETSIVLGGTGGVNVNWGKVSGATGYKIYGRATGSQQLLATVGDVSTWLDSGAISPSGALPVENTTGIIKYPYVDRLENKEFNYWHNNILKSSASRPQSLTRKNDTFLFNIYADADYVYVMRYYKRLSVLSESINNNWFSSNADELLLYSSLVKAAGWLGNDSRIKLWVESRDSLLKELKFRLQKEKRGGQLDVYISPNIFK